MTCVHCIVRMHITASVSEFSAVQPEAVVLDTINTLFHRFCEQRGIYLNFDLIAPHPF